MFYFPMQLYFWCKHLGGFLQHWNPLVDLHAYLALTWVCGRELQGEASIVWQRKEQRSLDLEYIYKENFITT